MASPFPGMDPYLENPTLWPGVHQKLISLIWMDLCNRLPPQYVAEMGERLYVEEVDRTILPDTYVLEALRAVKQTRSKRMAAAVCDPPWNVKLLRDDPIRETFVQILTTEEAARVVTVIEILSPSNKASNTPGREQYLAKQRMVLGSQTHLLEIDLLRDGAHTVVAPRGKLVRKGPWHYIVTLSRSQDRESCQAWGVTIRERLPRVAVPLDIGVDDLVLDLQELFTRCYDLAGYDRRIDYSRDPVVALPLKDQEWADALLRRRGLRK